MRRAARGADRAARTADITRRWRALPRWARIAMAVAGTLFVLNAGAAAIELATGGPQPSGPDSSSYATAGTGSAAYAALLARHGHPVSRLRKDVTAAPPGLEHTTLVVLDPRGVSREDAAALRVIVMEGGRLVTGDFGGDTPLLEALFTTPPVWSLRGGSVSHPLLPLPETAGIARVRADGAAVWRRPGDAVPAMGNTRGAFALTAALGRGRVVLLAETSPLSNRLLGRDDNAAFGLAIAGAPGRPVVFDEAIHGYGEATGLAALPARWKWALVIAFGATVVWMVASGRRFGPPEHAARQLPPARRAYVDAVAATLARTRQPAQAMAPARDRARTAVLRRTGLPGGAPTGDVRAAAIQLGLPADEADAIASGSDDPLVVGRAAVHASGART